MFKILGLFIFAVQISKIAAIETKKTSSEICSQPKMVGPCRAAFPRFWYNSESKKCEDFIYGGCDSNDNNFRTEEECRSTCVSPEGKNDEHELNDENVYYEFARRWGVLIRGRKIYSFLFDRVNEMKQAGSGGEIPVMTMSFIIVPIAARLMQCIM